MSISRYIIGALARCSFATSGSEDNALGWDAVKLVEITTAKLTNRQAAEPLGVALKTLENWRLAGKGLQELIGHATLAMTMRYAHLAPEHLRRAGGSTT